MRALLYTAIVTQSVFSQGLRTFHIGNSLTWWGGGGGKPSFASFEVIAQATGHPDHYSTSDQHAGITLCGHASTNCTIDKPSGRIEGWYLSAPKQWDWLFLQPYSLAATPDDDIRCGNELFQAFKEHNPSIKLAVYMHWPKVSQDESSPDLRSSAKSEWVEKLADGLQALNPGTEVVIVPSCAIIMTLRELADRGELPTLSSHGQLYQTTNENEGHVNHIGMYAIGIAYYLMTYKQDPDQLSTDLPTHFAVGWDHYDIDPDLGRTIREVVKQIVTSYPRSGVTMAELGTAELTLNTTTLEQAEKGIVYSATLSASGGSTPYTWSIIAGNLPLGLSLSQTSGTIAGTPSALGPSTFTVEVRDAEGVRRSRQLTLTVVKPVVPPTISWVSPPSGTQFPATVTSVQLAFDAHDADGAVAKIEIRESGQLLHTLTSAPWSWEWTGVSEGAYGLGAIAYDDDGNTGVTDVRMIMVGTPSGLPNLPHAGELGMSIDGSYDNGWSRSRVPLDNSLYSAPASAADLSATASVLWNEHYLFVCVAVLDDRAMNDNDEATVYMDDCVEVFIDGDHSGGTYGENDAHFFLPRNGGTAIEVLNGIRDVAFYPISGVSSESGYTLEIRIPWSDLGVTARAGMSLGFDVHVNDDDDGGDREHKVSWFGTQDNAYQSSDNLGTVHLVASEQSSAATPAGHQPKAQGSAPAGAVYRFNIQGRLLSVLDRVVGPRAIRPPADGMHVLKGPAGVVKSIGLHHR